MADVDYLNKTYFPYRFEQNEQGILRITRVDQFPLDGPANTSGKTGHELSHPGEPMSTVTNSSTTSLRNLWREVADDTSIKLVICTGDGSAWENIDTAAKPPKGFYNGLGWEHILFQRRQSLLAFLEIPVPIISAVNGPATSHAEWALLGDVVLASETATFQDKPHFIEDRVPGDGVQVIWPALIGWNRARHFFLTGTIFDAQRALDLGIVAEIVPGDRLLERAYELATVMLERDHLMTRLAMQVIRQEIKERILKGLGFGLALEGIGLIQQSIDAE